MANPARADKSGHGFRKFVAIAFALLLSVGVGGMACFISNGSSKTGRVIVDVRTIDDACNEYRQSTGAFPASLNDLVTGSKPYLEHGEDAITDPWGRPYQYDLNGPHSQGAKPDIFTVDPDGQTIGNWQDRGS